MLHAPDRHAHTIGQVEQDAEADGRPGHDLRVAEHRVPQRVDHAAGDDNGNRRDHHVEAQRAPEAPVAPSPLPAEPTEDDLPEIPPEIDQDRRQRADMDRHVHHQPLVLPAGDERHQHEVAGGAHRQELGDALNERENDDMKERHGRASRSVAADSPPPRLYHRRPVQGQATTPCIKSRSGPKIGGSRRAARPPIGWTNAGRCH